MVHFSDALKLALSLEANLLSIKDIKTIGDTRIEVILEFT